MSDLILKQGFVYVIHTSRTVKVVIAESEISAGDWDTPHITSQ